VRRAGCGYWTIFIGGGSAGFPKRGL
jgi:hypothetical protein